MNKNFKNFVLGVVITIATFILVWLMYSLPSKSTTFPEGVATTIGCFYLILTIIFCLCSLVNGMMEDCE